MQTYFPLFFTSKDLKLFADLLALLILFAEFRASLACDVLAKGHSLRVLERSTAFIGIYYGITCYERLIRRY